MKQSIFYQDKWFFINKTKFDHNDAKIVDFMIEEFNKLNEEYFLGATKTALKAKYGELLELRQQARERIRELEQNG